jgi:RNA ligase
MIEDKPEIRTMHQDGRMVVCYMVSTPTTFDNPHARECRGITFDSAGSIVSRPLTKFFNVGEKESTLPQNIDWSSIVRVMDKRDGSMIHTVKTTPGESLYSSTAIFDVKSKKSFKSDVANAARAWIKQNSNYEMFCGFIASANKTAIFEWTSPGARIVLNYKNSELQLLHVRDNVTGEYSGVDALDSYATHFGIKVVESDKTTLAISSALSMGIIDPKLMFVDLVNTIEDVEGWVLQFKNGDMVKIKTNWYMQRHRVMTGLRTRDVVELVLSEEIDDVKAKLAAESLDLTKINEIENDVLKVIRSIINAAEDLYQKNKHLDRKTVAITNKENPYFGLLMKLFSGGEPNYKEYFARNFLSSYDLNLIQFTDSIAEAE